MNDQLNSTPQGQMPPTVLGGFLQPGLPAKVYSCLFFNNCVVFGKTGSFSTDSAGTMRSALGGYTGAGMIAGAVGGLIDAASSANRTEKTAAMAGNMPDQIVASHKQNFKLDFDKISSVEIKGPNFAGEVKVIVNGGGASHKFRVDRQSKASAKYIVDVFQKFLAGKVSVR